MDFFEKGRVQGETHARTFPGTVLSMQELALLGRLVADFVADQRDRERYIDGFVVGFYEVNPAESTTSI
jgi:hypothetical protein